jgi:hypothetical protein
MDFTATVDAYVAAWNEQDAERRQVLLERAFSADGTYRDPLYSVVGRDALAEHIHGYQQRFPDSSMDRQSRIDGYGDVLRFAWAIVGPDGDVAIQGVDVVSVNDDGKIQSVTGFFGELA